MQSDAYVSAAIMQMPGNGVGPGRARAAAVWVLLQDVPCGGCRRSVSHGGRTMQRKASGRKRRLSADRQPLRARPNVSETETEGLDRWGKKHPLWKMFLDAGRRKGAAAGRACMCLKPGAPKHTCGMDKSRKITV